MVTVAVALVERFGTPLARGLEELQKHKSQQLIRIIEKATYFEEFDMELTLNGGEDDCKYENTIILT